MMLSERRNGTNTATPAGATRIGFMAAYCLMAGFAWAGQDAAPASGTRTVRVVAGSRYQAGGLHTTFFGSGYRELWATPIDVEVLDLARFSGGLVPDEKGGGKQTRSLEFKDPAGRKWKFRSIDKDPSAVLDEGLRGSFADAIVQDQISASLPANVLVVDALCEAAGIVHVDRRLYVLPDDPRLGEFRKEFAGMLGTLEEDPRAEPPVTPGFDEFTRLVDTKELEKLLDADPHERLDARAFLRARLFDAWIGDYDRHRDQWDWARHRQTGRWVPVPRDRDMAFVSFGGLALGVARASVPRLVKFEEQYPKTLGLTWQARFLDRRHLAELDWAAWQAVIADLQGRLTNRVIGEAVLRLPAPYHAKKGRWLASRLMRRRDRLPEFARRMYSLLAQDAEVHATDQPDSVQLLHLADGSVEVVASGSSGPYFRRSFHPAETDEVRVFLKGGDDRAVSEGRRHSPVRVRLVGGEGNDVLDDSAGGQTRFYDSSGDNRVVDGPGTWTSDRPYATPLDSDGHPVRDWGGGSGIRPWVRGGGGYGVILGGVFQKTRYGFRKHPFASRHSLRLGYSTKRSTGALYYEYQSLRTDNRTRLSLAARASALDLIHFYGFGNETGDTGSADVHDVKQIQYVLMPSYRLDVSSFDVALGPVLKYARTHPTDASLVGLERPYGVSSFGQLGARIAVGVGRRDDDMIAAKGARLEAEAAWYPAAWSVTQSFAPVHAEAVAFVSAPLPLRPTLAVRAGGRKLFGRYPLHEAAFVGGSSSLRGLPRQRYAGDASLYGNAELRLLLRKRDGGLVSRFGVLGLADSGRVFLEGETSERWHTGLGGGIWISLLEPGKTFSVVAAQSEGGLRLYVQGGFTF